jgi:predicted Zn-dependent protease
MVKIQKYPQGTSWLFIFLLILCSSVVGCSVKRRIVPLGKIPKAKPVSQADIEYGQNVLASLTSQYPLSNNDQDINKVRDVVERLSQAASADHDPWHPYVLQADNLVNAGATRGNFIFVWSGMLRVVESEGELAAILAHEIGHVLAGHTQPNPQEEANKMISQVAGVAAREVLRAQTGAGPFGDLAQALLTEAVKGFIVNPESQRQELEADQIGLFILADAGYDPREAVLFWGRVQNDPRFGAGSLEFFSSHPTSKTRLDHLKSFLHNAESRFRNRKGPVRKDNPWTFSVDKDRSNEQERRTKSSKTAPDQLQPWIVDSSRTPVFATPDGKLQKSEYLRPGEKVAVLCHSPGYLRIVRPIKGFISKSSALPLDRESLDIRPCKQPTKMDQSKS